MALRLILLVIVSLLTGTLATEDEILTGQTHTFVYESVTPQRVLTGCKGNIQAGKAASTTYYIIDGTGQPKIIEPGSIVNVIFPFATNPNYPNVPKTQFVKFDEICFPSKCNSPTCGTTVGPLEPENTISGGETFSSSLQSVQSSLSVKPGENNVVSTHSASTLASTGCGAANLQAQGLVGQSSNLAASGIPSRPSSAGLGEAAGGAAHGQGFPPANAIVSQIVGSQESSSSTVGLARPPAPLPSISQGSAPVSQSRPPFAEPNESGPAGLGEASGPAHGQGFPPANSVVSQAVGGQSSSSAGLGRPPSSSSSTGQGRPPSSSVGLGISSSSGSQGRPPSVGSSFQEDDEGRPSSLGSSSSDHGGSHGGDDDDHYPDCCKYCNNHNNNNNNNHNNKPLFPHPINFLPHIPNLPHGWTQWPFGKFPSKLDYKTSREDPSYYASLPGAIRGYANVIYYPSCDRDAYTQPAILNYCPGFEKGRELKVSESVVRT